MKTGYVPTRHRADAPPDTVGISRRQLLRGVAGSAAVGLLVTLPHQEAAASAPDGAHPDSDSLWLVGSRNGVEGYAAQVVSPAGKQVASVADLAHAVARTSDGNYVVDAAATAGQPTRVRIFSAGSGRVQRELKGGFAWPAEPDLTVAAGPTPTEVAVVATCLVSAPEGHSLTKDSPEGGTDTFASLSWRAYRAVEVFDVATGALVTSAAPTEIELGTATQVANLGNRLLLVEHGPAATTLLCSAVSSPHSVVATTTGGHAQLAHTDPSGRAYLLTDDGHMVIWSGSSVRATAPLALHSVQSRTARPFAPSVVTTSSGTVAVVDASRKYLASVDAVSGTVHVQRSLSTSDTFSPVTNRTGTGVAADPIRRRIYVADTSGVSGGVWVHDANTLEVLDRWHSDVGFGLVWVAPATGTVYLQSLEGPVAVHDVSGRLLSFLPSSLVTTRAL